jgi:hypothetical protein
VCRFLEVDLENWLLISVRPSVPWISILIVKRYSFSPMTGVPMPLDSPFLIGIGDACHLLS